MGTLGSDESSNRESERQHRDRGQTTLDFAIGISIFLAVLLFILLFLPGILSPFTESAQAETVSSNRVADQLTQGTLASPSEPYVLNEFCTAEFFEPDGDDADSNVPDRCNYPAGEVEEQVGVAESRQQVNITIRGNVSSAGNGNDLLCWDRDSDDSGLLESPNSDCDVTMSRGPSAPTNRPSITSVRVVALDGTDVTLQVEMW